MQYTAKITTIIHRNPKNYYTVAIVKMDGKSEVVVGYLPIVNTHLTINFFGKKETTKQNKMQYKVESYMIEFPKSDFELYYFLTNDFIRMPDDLAMSVSDFFGIEYLNIHKDTKKLEEKFGSEEFAKVRVHLQFASVSIEKVNEKFAVYKTMLKMGFANDLSAKVAFSLFDTTAKSIEQNPYQIIFPFDLDWKMVDTIALKNGIASKSKIRIKEAVFFLLEKEAKNKANIYMIRDELLTSLRQLIGKVFNETEYQKYENELIEEKRVFNYFNEQLYSYRYYQAEKQLALDIDRINSQPKENSELVMSLIEKAKQKDTFFSDTQFDALKTMLTNPISVVVGPAGSGKTTLLIKFIELVKDLQYYKKSEKQEDEAKNQQNVQTEPNEQHESLKICAFTGKATERIKEVTIHEANTIHTLLSHNPITKVPMYHSKNPLEFDVLVIEEASMVDTLVFSEIINATKKGCKVVIIGDEYQLPSIGPGKVLYELVNFSEIPIVKLDTIYRQEENSHILNFATKVRNGETDVHNLLTEKNNSLNFVPINSPQEIEQILLHTTKYLYKTSNLDFIKDMQILTPVHKGLLGTININSKVQAMLNSIHPQRKKLEYGNKVFFLGDKVMNLENNKDKKIFNGETGQIIDIDGRTIKVKYNKQKIISYENEEIFQLELGFATTVHKMQGSEASIIILLVHSSFYGMLQRKLLYTAATRAKIKLLLYGQEPAIINAIFTDTVLDRKCNLEIRLKESKLENLLTLT